MCVKNKKEMKQIKQSSIEQNTLSNIYKDYCNGISLRKLEKQYEIERHLISFELKEKYNISPKSFKDNNIKNEDEKEIIELYNNGISIDSICKKFHCGCIKIKEILIKNNIIKYELAQIDSEILKFYSVKNKSIGWISKTLHKSRGYVGMILKQNNIVIAKTSRIQFFDSSVFHIIDTSEKAYWLGFLYADGYINEKTNRIEITLCEDDKNHLEKFIKFIKGQHIKIYNKSVRLKDYEKIYKASRIDIMSKELTNDLVNLGCWQNKSLDKKPPLIDNLYIKDFIAGYFDGNGNCRQGDTGYRRIGFDTGSKLFADFIHNNLNENSIYNTLKQGKDRRENTFSIRIERTNSVIKFIELYYNNPTLANTYLARKKEILK